jgi:hypothetical protein
LKAISSIFSIKAYPNPAHDFVNLHLNGVSSPKGKVFIIDLSGKVIKTQVITATDTKIDMAGLATGVYLLKYADGVHDARFRIIKK